MKNISSLAKNKIASVKKARNELALDTLRLFAEGLPVDKAVRKFFMQKKYLGSRDRRYIGDCLFSLYRWWGWIRICSAADCEIRKLAFCPEKLDFCLDAAEWISEFCKNFRGDFTAEGINLLRAELCRKYGILAEKLSYNLLLPEYFQKKLTDIFNASDLIGVFQTRPSIWLRLRKSTAENVKSMLRERGIIFSSPKEFPHSVKISDIKGVLYESAEYRSGLFEIQDLSSQMIGYFSFPEKGERWLDACAGAGGKTIQIAEIVGDRNIEANDSSPEKIEVLKDRLKRCGFSRIKTHLRDLSVPQNAKNIYDGILVDAPCSCSGVWRRNPDGRWRYNEEEIAKFASRQLSILKSVLPMLKRGGKLIYATCSVFKTENEEVIMRFLSGHKGEIEIENADFKLPESVIERNGFFYVDGRIADSDYAFITRMRRL